MSNFIEPSIVDAITERLRNGESLRSVAADLEISKGTVARYKALFVAAEPTPISCSCGQQAGHRGWCSYRYAKSPARQKFMARWSAGRLPAIIRIKSPPLLDLRYPFVPPQAPKTHGSDLLLLVNGIVPRGLPEQLRGDVCQDIILAVLSGDLNEIEIPKQLQSFIRHARQSGETHYMAVSIDQPRRDGSSWHDFLPAPGSEACET